MSDPKRGASRNPNGAVPAGWPGLITPDSEGCGRSAIRSGARRGPDGPDAAEVDDAFKS